VIPLRVKVQRLRPPDVIQRLFNLWVREGLLLAGEWWIRNRLPLHFGPQATQRFKYALRTALWMVRKARKLGDLPTAKTLGIALKRGSGFGQLLQDKRPFEFSGQLKGVAIGSARATALATANTTRVEVKVPLGHPINEKHSGELTMLLDMERKEMRKIVVEHVRMRLREFREPREVRLAA